MLEGMGSWRVIILGSVGALFLLSVLAFVTFQSLVTKPLVTGNSIQTIDIPRGIGSGGIGELLEQRGIIRHRYLWYYHLWHKGISHRLKAGEYELSAAMTIPKIAEKMVKGEAVSSGVKVTIPEGFTFDEVEARLWEAGFTNVSMEAEMRKLNIKEGYLFPDTYFFEKDATAEEIIRKISDNFDEKIKDLKISIPKSGRTLDEIIIMASLIEEEIPHEEDRPRAAGILWKRLDAGMPLQVDATVLYAKGIRGGGGEKRILSREDLVLPSPYNTYVYQGLPPGAIANPGLGAIRAAVLSIESDYWYYLSKPDRETVFSRTAEEHTQAKTLYLR